MTPQDIVDEWNDRHPPGTEVEWRGRPAETRVARTGSGAFLSQGHPAVMIAGEAEPWSPASVTPRGLAEARRLRDERDALYAACKAILDGLRSRKGTDEEGRLSFRETRLLKAALALADGSPDRE